MAFPRAHYYLAMSGAHYGAERFSFGLRLNGPGGTFGDRIAQQDLCDDITAAVSTWWQSQGTIGANSALDLVKLNVVGTDGKYVNGYTNQTELLGGVTSGVGSTHPPQVALVATLVTNAGRGLSGKGRIYLPSPTFSVGGSSGTISEADALTAATSVKGLLDAINTAADPVRVRVISGTRTGAESTVQRVEVGRVLDTMRSRRTSLLEVRQPAALAGAPFPD